MEWRLKPFYQIFITPIANKKAGECKQWKDMR